MACFCWLGQENNFSFAPKNLERKIEGRMEERKTSTCVGGTFGFLISFVIFFFSPPPS